MKDVTGQDLRDVLNIMGINQREWADMMDRDARQVRRWVSGENPIPRPVAILIRWVQLQPHDGALLRQIVDEAPRKAPPDQQGDG